MYKCILLSVFSILFLWILWAHTQNNPSCKDFNRSVLWAESEGGWTENAPSPGVKSAHFPASVSCHHKCCCLTLRGNTIWQQRQELTLWGAQGLGRRGRTEDRETRGKCSGDWRRILNGQYVTRNTSTVSSRLTVKHPVASYKTIQPLIGILGWFWSWPFWL